ncbi:hypothetical protein P153DRAFT_362673 [Dothidotthia symphoricarpi CBS 119687]|uniref:Uncharacterized protein n=1 Tax=Dothidotthia symphoricarpi CBS 119687 TaxID=1392245 RepID=A0A6A6AVI6_9PLEO|nr:uncharacterized protein P153DRAFT_362673 [Dothidotthia symphoricarpi CBS 119687]KAF2134964.1 hypothetical protein P153DRAFT_362673 [Dothidotthia symphoricarpi CBS 119687]
MKVAMISARYMEQHAVEDFLGQVFGYGKAQVTWTRGRFQCLLPRALTKDELESMKAAVDFAHYAES